MFNWTRKPGKMAALDFDRRRLRVTEYAATRDGARIVALKSVPMPGGTDVASAEAVGKVVADTLRQMGLSGCRATMSVPRGQAVLKPLSLPADTPETELAGMVQYQIGKDLPYPAAEAVVDFVPERHFGDGVEVQAGEGVGVLVAAVRLPVVDFFRRVAEVAGVRLQRLDLRPSANMRCVDRCTKRQAAECVALVDLTADETEIDFFIGRSLAFSRSVAAPEEAAGAEARGQAVQSVVLEVVRSLQSFAAVHRGGRVTGLLVAGESGLAGEVVRALAQRVDAKCEVFSPADALGLPTPSDASCFSAVLGLAMGEREGDGFDFLDPRRPAVPRDTRPIRVAIISLACLAAVLAAVISGWVYLAGKAERVRLLADQVKQAEQYHTEEVVPLAYRVSAIQDWDIQRIDWLDHWAQLSRLFPPATEAYIGALKTSVGGVMKFTVHAKSRETIDQLEKALAAVEGYKVKASRVDTRVDPLQMGYDQESNMEVIVSPKAKVVLTGEAPARPADDDPGGLRQPRGDPSGGAPARRTRPTRGQPG